MNSKRRGNECPIQFLESLSYFSPIHLLAGYGKLATARLRTIILPTVDSYLALIVRCMDSVSYTHLRAHET